MTRLNKEEQAYLYVIKRMQDNPNFGKTLFYKILYFSDFDNYELTQKPITGSEYRKIALGPAPCDFDKTVSSLKQKNLVKEKRVPLGRVTQTRYCSNYDGEFDALSDKEKTVLDNSIKRLSGMTAVQVSAYSHEDMPFKATKDGEKIEYELVFYRNPLFSVTANKA